MKNKRQEDIVNILFKNSMETSSNTETVIKFSINFLLKANFLLFSKGNKFYFKFYQIILVLLYNNKHSNLKKIDK